MKGMNISNLDNEVFTPPSKRHDGHTEALEEKVDALEVEIKLLKKQIKKKNKLPTDMVTKEKYDDVLRQLKEYWDAEIPF